MGGTGGIHLIEFLQQDGLALMGVSFYVWAEDPVHLLEQVVEHSLAFVPSYLNGGYKVVKVEFNVVKSSLLLLVSK